MLHTGARAANRVRNLRGFSFLHRGQSVHGLAVTPASLSAQPLWPVPAVPAATTAALRHRYSRAHRHRSCPSRRLQPPRRARRSWASAWLEGAKWRAAGETWAPQAELWRKCTVAGLYFQRFGRHICPFVKRGSSEHLLFTQNLQWWRKNGKSVSIRFQAVGTVMRTAPQRRLWWSWPRTNHLVVLMVQWSAAPPLVAQKAAAAEPSIRHRRWRLRAPSAHLGAAGAARRQQALGAPNRPSRCVTGPVYRAASAPVRARGCGAAAARQPPRRCSSAVRGRSCRSARAAARPAAGLSRDSRFGG